MSSLRSAWSPRVSIGLPVYNAENYLEEAVDSILKQTFSDFELIISDNQSTDRTESICRCYVASDDRVRYVRQAENLGLTWNFNEVLRLARAPYFRWACHDDVLEPELLERCVAILDAHPEVVGATPRSLAIDEHGVPNPDHPYFRTLDLRNTDPSERLAEFFRQYRWGGCGSQFFSVFRTDVLRETRRLEPFTSADHVLVAEMVLRGQLWQTKERLFQKRLHDLGSLVANDFQVEKIAAFLDPSTGGKTQWLESIWLQRFLSMIARVPMTRSQRLSCYRALYREWFVYHARRLAKEWYVRVVESVTFGRRRAKKGVAGFGTYYEFG